VRVRLGWSGETSDNVWQKVDVELEEDDLARILREAEMPEGLSARLPAKVCYQLMQNEAEFMLLGKLKFLGYPVDKAQARQAVLLGSTQEILTSISAMLSAA
jgi:hypothetical protein